MSNKSFEKQLEDIQQLTLKSPKDAEEQLKNFLRSLSFTEDDLKTFRMINGCFSGQTDQVPLSLCGIESMPDLDIPVILSVDTDYFPSMASVKNIKIDNLSLSVK